MNKGHIDGSMLRGTQGPTERASNGQLEQFEQQNRAIWGYIPKYEIPVSQYCYK